MLQVVESNKAKRKACRAALRHVNGGSRERTRQAGQPIETDDVWCYALPPSDLPSKSGGKERSGEVAQLVRARES